MFHFSNKLLAYLLTHLVLMKVMYKVVNDYSTVNITSMIY